MSLPILPVLVFAMLMLAASLHGLTASGHFPRDTRIPAMATGTGPIVLWVSIAIVIAALAVGLIAAWRSIPWYAAVIAGGGGILIAPLVLQLFPDRFVDGKRGLIAFALAALILAWILIYVLREIG